MKSLKRYQLTDTDYFLTLVTKERERLLLDDVGLFHDSWGDIKITAWVILPDHCHVILNTGKKTISDIVHHFKITYSRRFRDRYRPGPVWQPRFWDHIIRDQDDLNHHLDYIHYNPVKHGFTSDPLAYAHSSLLLWKRRGFYEADWGVSEKIVFEGRFGE